MSTHAETMGFREPGSGRCYPVRRAGHKLGLCGNRSIVDMREQETGRGTPHVFDRDVSGGQDGGHVGSEFLVVGTGNGNVAGNSNAHDMRFEHRPEHENVVSVDDFGRPLNRRDDTPGGPSTVCDHATAVFSRSFPPKE